MALTCVPIHLVTPQPFTGTGKVYNQQGTLSSGDTTITLEHHAGENATLILVIGGVYQSPSVYSVSGNTITLNEAIEEELDYVVTYGNILLKTASVNISSLSLRAFFQYQTVSESYTANTEYEIPLEYSTSPLNLMIFTNGILVDPSTVEYVDSTHIKTSVDISSPITFIALQSSQSESSGTGLDTGIGGAVLPEYDWTDEIETGFYYPETKKPVYERVVYVDTNTSYSISNFGIEDIVSVRSINDKADGTFYPVGYIDKKGLCSDVNKAYGSRCLYASSSKIFYQYYNGTTNYSGGCGRYVFIRYTKTKDTANNSLDTNTTRYAYKPVATGDYWIDGKPIYEAWLASWNASIDTFISYEGYSIFSVSTERYEVPFYNPNLGVSTNTSISSSGSADMEGIYRFTINE